MARTSLLRQLRLTDAPGDEPDRQPRGVTADDLIARVRSAQEDTRAAYDRFLHCFAEMQRHQRALADYVNDAELGVMCTVDQITPEELAAGRRQSS